MDYPSIMANQDSLDPVSAHGYEDLMLDRSGSPDFAFYINEEACETPNLADEDEQLASINQDAIFHEDTMVLDEEYGSMDQECKQDTMDPLSRKCICRECTNKAFDREIKEAFNLDIPDLPHVLYFQLPEGDTEQFNSDGFLAHQVPAESSTPVPQVAPMMQQSDIPRRSTREKTKVSSKVPQSTAEEALALIKDALRSNGTLPEDLLAKMQRLADGAEHNQAPQDHHTAGCAQVDRHSGPHRNSRQTSRRVSGDEALRAFPPSTFRPRIAASELSATSSHNGASTATLARSSTPHMNILYQCTYRCCDNGTIKLCNRSHTSRYEWERHEKSVHKHRYMCKECASEHTHPHGGYACGFCIDPDLPPFYSLEAVKSHTLKCLSAREAGTSYHRKDKLRTHLRQHHGMRNPPEASFEWVYDIDNEWLKECGFCGLIFDVDDWNHRATHIEEHFKNGADITTWTVPFPKTRKTRPNGSELDGSDEDEDDEDESSDDDESDDNDNNNDSSYVWGKLQQNSSAYTPNPAFDASMQRSSNTCFLSDRWQQYGATPYDGQHCQSLSPLENWLDHEEKLERFSRLEHWLAHEEQYERLLLGLGRRPLNVVIGQLERPEPAPPESTNPEVEHSLASTEIPGQSDFGNTSSKVTMQVQSRLELERSSTNEAVGVPRDFYPKTIEDAKIQLVRSRHAHHPKRIEASSSDLNLESFTPRKDSSTWKVRFYRERSLTNNTISTSSSGTADESGFSRHSSLASTAPSINFVAPLDVHALLSARFAPMVDFGWELPCEFAFTGCDITFPPANYANWFNHELSHFQGTFPSKAICPFCDEEDAIFLQATENPHAHWANRMHHISEHFASGDEFEHHRPDFWVIEHMWKTGLLNDKDYRDAMSFTERPECEGLVPHGYETPEMIRKKKKKLEVCNNLAEERRQRRREIQKCKSQEVKRVIAKPQISSERQLTHKNLTETFTLGQFGLGRKGNTVGTITIGRTAQPLTTTLKAVPQRLAQSLANSCGRSTSPSDKTARIASSDSNLTSVARSNASKHTEGLVPPPIRQSPIISRRRPGSSRQLPIIIHKIHQGSDGPDDYSLEKAPPVAGLSIDKISSINYSNPKNTHGVITKHHRVSDDDRRYITSRKSHNGRTVVIDHQKSRYDPQEPQSSAARYNDYERTREYRRR